MLGRAERSGGFRRTGRRIVLDSYPGGVLDGSKSAGHSGLAGGDGLAVAAAVGAVGQVLAEPLDLAT
jgi:hypothetical protein